MTFLTDEERTRFSTWLKEQASSERALLEQMGKLHLSDTMDVALKQRMKTRCAAYLLIALELDNTESCTIEEMENEER